MMLSSPKVVLLSCFILSYIIPSFGIDEIQDVVNGIKFMDCDSELYYSSLLAQNNDTTMWTRDALFVLLKTRHRNILPTNSDNGGNGNDDIYAAVMDLDRGTEVGSVQLIYRDVAVDAAPQANVWEIERLWTLKENSSAVFSAFNDVHHLRPVDEAVLKGKNASSFGMCDTVSSVATCIIPATSVTGWDTAQDGKVWQPPQSKRGEIARALMYMDLRYQDLTLQDCDPAEGQLGYLSQLLQWHAEYPPDEGEMQRNSRACSRWQGNRNPFVDYPELAEAIYGSPQELLSSRSYPGCDDASEMEDLLSNQSPSQHPSATPDGCSTISEGALSFFLVNTVDPDEVVILALEKIAGGIELYLTDQAWDGEDLVRGEKNEGAVVVSLGVDRIGAALAQSGTSN